MPVSVKSYVSGGVCKVTIAVAVAAVAVCGKESLYIRQLFSYDEQCSQEEEVESN